MDPDFELIAKVRQIHSDTRGSYGSRRMSGQLRDDGYDIGRYRARSLMKKAGVSVKRRKKFKSKLEELETYLDRKLTGLEYLKLEEQLINQKIILAEQAIPEVRPVVPEPRPDQIPKLMEKSDKD